MTKSGAKIGYSVFCVSLVFGVLSIGHQTARADATPGQQPASGIYENSQGSPLIPLVRSATRSVDVEIYTMTDRGFRAALREAIDRGVRVRIIKDPKPVEHEECDMLAKPSSRDSADCTDLKHLTAQIRSAGGAVVPFNKPTLCGKPAPRPAPRNEIEPQNAQNLEPQSSECYQHGKLVIADRAAALVSTGNFDSSNLCTSTKKSDRCNRDFSAIIRNPQMVSALVAVFENDLRGQPYDLPSIIAPVAGMLTVSPFSLQPLLQFINSAQHSIVIENQYLHEPDINAALMKKAEAGVLVRVVVASLCYFDRPSDSEKENETKRFGAFDAAGIQSRMFTRQIQINGHPGYLHAKTIVVDGARAWVGSVNGSVSATSKNREFGLFFSDERSVQFVQNWTKSDFTDAGSETWEESLMCTKDVD